MVDFLLRCIFVCMLLLTSSYNRLTHAQDDDDEEPTTERTEDEITSTTTEEPLTTVATPLEEIVEDDGEDESSGTFALAAPPPLSSSSSSNAKQGETISFSGAGGKHSTHHKASQSADKNKSRHGWSGKGLGGASNLLNVLQNQNENINLAGGAENNLEGSNSGEIENEAGIGANILEKLQNIPTIASELLAPLLAFAQNNLLIVILAIILLIILLAIFGFSTYIISMLKNPNLPQLSTISEQLSKMNKEDNVSVDLGSVDFDENEKKMKKDKNHEKNKRGFKDRLRKFFRNENESADAEDFGHEKKSKKSRFRKNKNLVHEVSIENNAPVNSQILEENLQTSQNLKTETEKPTKAKKYLRTKEEIIESLQRERNAAFINENLDQIVEIENKEAFSMPEISNKSETPSISEEKEKLNEILANKDAFNNIKDMMKNPEELEKIKNLIKNPEKLDKISNLISKPDELKNIESIAQNPQELKQIETIVKNPEELSKLDNMLKNPSDLNKIDDLLSNEAQLERLKNILKNPIELETIENIVQKPSELFKIEWLTKNQEENKNISSDEAENDENIQKSAALEKLDKILEKFDEIEDFDEDFSSNQKNDTISEPKKPEESKIDEIPKKLEKSPITPPVKKNPPSRLMRPPPKIGDKKTGVARNPKPKIETPKHVQFSEDFTNGIKNEYDS